VCPLPHFKKVNHTVSARSIALVKDSLMSRQRHEAVMCAATTSVGIGSVIIMEFGRRTEFSRWNLRKTSCSMHSGRPPADPGRRQRIREYTWTELQTSGCFQAVYRVNFSLTLPTFYMLRYLSAQKYVEVRILDLLWKSLYIKQDCIASLT